MNKFKTLTVINSILLLLILITTIIFYFNSNEQKTNTIGFVNSTKLFNEFNMTKDIMHVEEKKMNQQKRTLDSLLYLFQNSKDKDDAIAKNLQSQIALNNQLLQKTQEDCSINISQTVGNRLESYIKEYGKANNLKIIIGSNRNGTILYVDDTINITDNVLEYINTKYEGN